MDDDHAKWRLEELNQLLDLICTELLSKVQALHTTGEAEVGQRNAKGSRGVYLAHEGNGGGTIWSCWKPAETS